MVPVIDSCQSLSRDFLWLLIDSQLFDSHRRASFFLYLTFWNLDSFTTAFEECFSVFWYLGLPYLLSVLISLLFHQVFTTTIMIKMSYLYSILLWYFIRPLPSDQDYHHRSFLMRVTIKDVAKLAGVAPSTVTRHQESKSTISDETKNVSVGHGRGGLPSWSYARSLSANLVRSHYLWSTNRWWRLCKNPFFPTLF